MVTDFLAAGTAIIDALDAAAIDGVEGIYPMGNANIAQAVVGRPTPSLHVGFGGYEVIPAHRLGPLASVRQTWLVVVYTADPEDPNCGCRARIDAGPVCAAVLSALVGKTLGDDLRRIELATPPRELYGIGRFMIPLAFTVAFDIFPT